MTESDAKAMKWRYEFKKNDPPESKTAFEDLVKDEEDPLTELDIEDEFKVEHLGIAIHKGEEGKCQLVQLSEGTLNIDFKNFIVHFPQEIVGHYETIGSVDIPAKRVRYCGFSWFGADGVMRNDGRVVHLSLWSDEREIQNAYFVATDQRSAMLLVSALTRLIYESSGKSAVRTHRFYSMIDGPIAVATGTTGERDIRDKIRMNQSELRKRDIERGIDPGPVRRPKADTTGDGNDDSGTSERDELMGPDAVAALKPLRLSPLFAILDEESFQLFDKPFSFTPLHTFLFYREQVKNVIDTIYVCQEEDQLEIQKDGRVYYMQPLHDAVEPLKERSGVVFKDLVEMLRRGAVKPKPKDTFTGSGKEFESFFSSGYVNQPFRMPKLPGSLMADQPPAAAPGPTAAQFPPRSFQEPPMFAEDRMAKHKFRRPNEDFDRPMPRDEDPTSATGANWLQNLMTGEHLHSVSEDMQATWFTMVADIDQVIKEGKIPHTDIASAGLDPKSQEHLRNIIEAIKDKIMANNYAEAVSQFRGCMEVYGTTLLSAIKDEPESDIIKRIFFLSG